MRPEKTAKLVSAQVTVPNRRVSPNRGGRVTTHHHVVCCSRSMGPSCIVMRHLLGRRPVKVSPAEDQHAVGEFGSVHQRDDRPGVSWSAGPSADDRGFEREFDIRELGRMSTHSANTTTSTTSLRRRRPCRVSELGHGV
jgi:hypothetical protein